MIIYKSDKDLPPREYLLPFWFAPTSDLPMPEALGFTLVVIAQYDMGVEDFRWADDDIVGKFPLKPSVDLVYEIHRFETDVEARAFIKAWWAEGD